MLISLKITFNNGDVAYRKSISSLKDARKKLIGKIEKFYTEEQGEFYLTITKVETGYQKGE